MNIDKVTEFNVQSSTNDDNQNSFISLLNHHKDVGVVKSTLVVVKSANGHIDRLPRKIRFVCVVLVAPPLLLPTRFRKFPLKQIA